MTSAILYSLTNILYLPFALHRKPCLKESSFTVSGNKKHSSSDPTAGLAPICLADKPKWRRRISNVFIDDRGFPDKSDYYDNLLHNIEGGLILRILKHLPPPSMRSTLNSTALMMSPNRESSCNETLTSPIWTHTYKRRSMHLSRSTGWCLTRKASLFW